MLCRGSFCRGACSCRGPCRAAPFRCWRLKNCCNTCCGVSLALRSGLALARSSCLGWRALAAVECGAAGIRQCLHCCSQHGAVWTGGLAFGAAAFGGGHVSGDFAQVRRFCSGLARASTWLQREGACRDMPPCSMTGNDPVCRDDVGASFGRCGVQGRRHSSACACDDVRRAAGQHARLGGLLLDFGAEAAQSRLQSADCVTVVALQEQRSDASQRVAGTLPAARHSTRRARQSVLTATEWLVQPAPAEMGRLQPRTVGDMEMYCMQVCDGGPGALVAGAALALAQQHTGKTSICNKNGSRLQERGLCRAIG